MVPLTTPPVTVRLLLPLFPVSPAAVAPMMAAVAVALAFQFPLSGLWQGSTYTISPHVAADNAAMAVVPDGAGRGYYGEHALAPARTLVELPHNQTWQDAAALMEKALQAAVGKSTTPRPPAAASSRA